MGNGANSWEPRKQTSVAEAEYMCQAAKEAIWLEGLLEDFRVDLKTSMLVYDEPSHSHRTPFFTHARNTSTSSITSLGNSLKLVALLSNTSTRRPWWPMRS